MPVIATVRLRELNLGCRFPPAVSIAVGNPSQFSLYIHHSHAVSVSRGSQAADSESLLKSCVMAACSLAFSFHVFAAFFFFLGVSSLLLLESSSCPNLQYFAI